MSRNIPFPQQNVAVYEPFDPIYNEYNLDEYMLARPMIGGTAPGVQENYAMQNGRYLAGLGSTHFNAPRQYPDEALDELEQEDDTFGSGIFDSVGTTTVNKTMGIFEDHYNIPGWIGREIQFAVSQEVADVTNGADVVTVPGGGMSYVDRGLIPQYYDQFAPTPLRPQYRPPPPTGRGETFVDLNPYPEQYPDMPMVDSGVAQPGAQITRGPRFPAILVSPPIVEYVPHQRYPRPLPQRPMPPGMRPVRRPGRTPGGLPPLTQMPPGGGGRRPPGGGLPPLTQMPHGPGRGTPGAPGMPMPGDGTTSSPPQGIPVTPSGTIAEGGGFMPQLPPITQGSVPGVGPQVDPGYTASVMRRPRGAGSGGGQAFPPPAVNQQAQQPGGPRLAATRGFGAYEPFRPSDVPAYPRERSVGKQFITNVDVISEPPGGYSLPPVPFRENFRPVGLVSTVNVGTPRQGVTRSLGADSSSSPGVGTFAFAGILMGAAAALLMSSTEKKSKAKGKRR